MNEAEMTFLEEGLKNLGLSLYSPVSSFLLF